MARNTKKPAAGSAADETRTDADRARSEVEGAEPIEARGTVEESVALPHEVSPDVLRDEDGAPVDGVSAGEVTALEDATMSTDDIGKADPVAADPAEVVDGGRDPVSGETATAAGSGDSAADETSPVGAETEGGAPDADATSEADGKRDAAVPPPAPEQQRNGAGFVPLVLGGLVAGAIGYAIPVYFLPSTAPVDESARIEALETELAALRDRPAPPQVDLAPVETAQSDLGARIDALGARVDTLEGQPVADPAAQAARASTASDAIDQVEGGLIDLTDRVGTIETEVAALRDDLGGRVDDLGGRVQAVEDGLSEAAARSDDVEDEAQTLAREAARNQVSQALESGAHYAEPLAVLGDAPDALAGPAETGVATVASLTDAFPPLAREALRVAREAEPEAGVGSLFRNAFNPRSLEPREGDDPDAVLSRAEAAVREGDIAGALAEIEKLPPAAQDVLSDWTARARTRSDAVTAAADYLQDG